MESQKKDSIDPGRIQHFFKESDHVLSVVNLMQLYAQTGREDVRCNEVLVNRLSIEENAYHRVHDNP